MATASPDPVTQAAAYQQHLLGLLGQDDPAQVQAATRARLLALLEVFSTLRTANLRLWDRSSAEDRRRVALHAERGAESYELMFRMLAGHDRFHLDQMRHTLGLIRAAR